MATVGVGSVLSLINFVFSFNVFTLVSWISVFGLAFKFLRKEYLIWSGSGVMNMQDDEDIIPFLRDKSKSHYPSNRSFLEPTKCPTCGQSTKVYTVPRPKVLCTKAVFYVYLILLALLFVVLGIWIVGVALFPAYSLYLSPYLPTKHNLQQFSNSDSRTAQELLMDAFVYRNFSTNAMHIPDNYRQLLNITLVSEEESLNTCKMYLEDGKGLLTIIQDVKEVSKNKDLIIQSLPPINTILSGLNATFYPYLDFLPLNIPLVQDAVGFIKDGDYSYSAVKNFTENHHVFTRDLLQITVAELPDVALDPLSLIDPSFKKDILDLQDSMKRNITNLSTELVQKSSTAYGRVYTIVRGFFINEDLSQFEEIPPEFVEMFTLLQQKVIYYKEMLVKLLDVLPQFVDCMSEQNVNQIQLLKGFVVSSYLNYYKIHYWYSSFVVLVIILILSLIVYMSIKGIKLMKETMVYAKSLLEAASEETIDAINDLHKAMNQ